MKNYIKKVFCAALLLAGPICFAQQPSTQQNPQVKKDAPAAPAKKDDGKKGTGTKNKIAVSDQAQPSDKNAKKTAKKTTGATEK